MVDTSKTKAQLIKELEILRDRVRTLEEAQIPFGPNGAYLRSIAESAPVGIGLYRNGVTLYVNQTYLRMAGYSDKAELIGKHFTELVAPQCREELAERNRRREQGEDVSASYQTIGLRKDGTEYPIQVQAAYIELPDGAATVGFFTDISGRLEAEETARRAETKYRDIYENAIEGIFQSTPQGTFLAVNPAMARIYGYASPEDMIATISNIPKQIYADPQARVEFAQSLQQNGKIEGFETRGLRKDGSIIWISCNARAVYDDHGTIMYYEGTLEDITVRKQAEEQLMLLKLSVDASSDGAYWMNPEGRFLYVNEAGCKALGYSQEELLQMRIFDINPRVTLQRWNDVWKELRKERHFTSESIHRRKDGSEFPVEINSTYLQFAGQEYCNGFAHDISNRKQVEEALRESEQKFRRMADQTPMMIGVTDEDGNITFLNKTWLDFRGKTLQEEAGWAWSAGLHPEDRDRVQAAMESSIERREPYCVEYRIQDRHGAYHWVIDTAAPLLDADGKPQGYVGTALDITDRKQAEEALRESEERSRIISELATDYAFIVDVDQQGALELRWASDTMSRVTGRSAASVKTGDMWKDVIVPEDWQKFSQFVQQMVVTRQSDEIETRSFRKDGSVHWLQIIASPKAGDTGSLIIVGAVKDITERKRAEEALRESEEKFRHIVRASPMGMHMYRLEPDDRLVFIEANPAADHILGVDNSQFVGKTIEEAFPLLTETEAPQRYRLAAAKGEAWHTDQITYKEGKISGAFEVDAFQTSPEHMVALFVDITDRKRAEEVLQQYTARLETLHEIDQAILLAETPHAIAEAALGHLRELIPCQRASVGIFDFEHDRVEAIASYAPDKAQLVTGMKVPMKQFGIDDELLHGRISLTHDLATQPYLPEVRQGLLRQGIRSIINVPLVVQGELIGTLNLGASEPGSFTDERIEIAREVADQLAITIQHARLRERDQRHTEELEQRVDERTVELRAAYDQLQALSRIKDEFVSNVSHELRSPIASAKAYLHLLVAHPDKQEKYIETLKREVMRLEHLIEGLLTLSRLDQNRISTDLTSVDLNDLLDEYITDRTPLAEAKNLTLSFEPSVDMPGVIGDRQLIGDVLSILLTNAVNYTLAGGRVSVGTHIETSENGAWAGFSVSDSGSGVAPEELPLLFERFYRGKAARETQVSGTGLGLSIAKEIIDLHCGRIEVHSDGIPGHGTKFNVWLPVEISS